MRTSHTATNTQSGNVFFYLFIAVALLGALSFAVSQSSRQTGKGLTDDRAKLAATEIISYGDTLAKAVGQMRLRGIKPYQLSFAHNDAHAGYGTYDDRPRTEVFNPQGGGVIYHQPPILAGTGAPLVYEFVGAFAVEGIGQSDCTPPAQPASDCSELLVVVTNLHETTCRMINKLLSIHEPHETLPEDDETPNTPRFVGNDSGAPDPFTYTSTIAEDNASAILRQRSAGCYKNGTNYIFYQVLLSR